MAERQAKQLWPASLAQQSWWHYERYAQGEVVACAFRLDGDLDVSTLRAAVEEVLRRHDSLRTTFRQRGGQIWQVVAPSPCPTTSLQVVDIPRAGATRQAGRQARMGMDAAGARLAQDLRRPFDLAHAPPIRVSLFKLDRGKHILLLVIHHIAADGTSMAILLHELSVLYAAFLNGQPSPLPAPMQYPEFTAWQYDQLRAGVLRDQLDHWMAVLAGADLHLDLSTRRSRPARLPYWPKTQRFAISEAAAAAVRSALKPYRTTPFMVLMAAFQTLLAGWGRTGDVVVGAPAANRVRPRTRTVVGLVFNEVLYRSRVVGGMRTAELLGHVRSVALDALAHQEVPLEAIFLASGTSLDQAQRGLDYTAWLQLNYEAFYELNLPGCRATRIELHDLDSSSDNQVRHVDWDPTVSLVVTERRDGSLVGSFRFNANMLDEETVELAAQQYNRLLEAMTGDGTLITSP